MREVPTKVLFFWKHHGLCNIGLVVAILGFCLFIRSADADSVCYSKACNETAESMAKNMDLQVEPCNNFYKYACGNYLNTTKIPASEKVLDFYTTLKHNVMKRLNDSLNANNNNDKKPYRLVRTLYKSCIDEDKIEKNSIKHLTTKIKSIGGWPVVDGDSWNETAFDYPNAIYKLYQYGFDVNFLITLSVNTNPTNKTQRTIFLSRPKLALDELVLDAKDPVTVSKDYLTLMKNIAKEFKAEANRAAFEMEQAMIFEEHLSYMGSDPRDDELDIPMTISKLNRKYPSIPWLEYINNQLPGSLKVSEDEIVIVDYPGYFARLDLMLTWISKKTIANYIVWRAILQTLPYLNKQVENHLVAFDTTPKNATSLPTRWMECILTTKTLKTAIDYVYVREHFDRKTKEEAVNMMNYIKKSLVDIFHQSTWMDNTTEKLFLEKLANTTTYVAYPDELFDDEKIDKYFQDFDLSDEDTFFENMIKINKFNKDQLHAQLREPIRSDIDWKDIPVLFEEAQYLPIDLLYVTAHIIQDFTFNKNRPMYVNYGILGTIMSHELTHAFGPAFIRRDKYFNTVPLTDSTMDFYEERMKCVSEQYSNYTMDEVEFHVNNRSTMEENIADIEGVRLAYKAYNEWTKKYGTENSTLPGIKESSNQLFWLSYANLWCEKYKKENFFDIYLKASHCPNEIRIMGSLASNPEFAKAYNCPPGSPMNPIHRCKTF